MTRKIPLTHGHVALVDDADYEWLTRGGKWNAGGHEPHLYAVRTIWEGKRSFGQRMHRLLLPSAKYVDHVNRNTLDNRRANLREATASQNAANRRQRADSKNKFKGVGRSVSPHSPWLASITVRGEFHHLGIFKTQVEAARAYDEAALIHFGEFAHLNFKREEG